MPRKGRDREIIVSQIEELLINDNNFKITSPDYLIDKFTNQKREVDISIKGSVGTHDILIVIECRQRKHKEDTTWIEQLGNKKLDLHIDKIIAVSSSDFTQPAKIKAKFYNIELRILKDVNAETINDWINKITFETSGYNLEFTDIQIGYLINEYNGIIDPKHLDEPITSDDVVITLSDKILVLKEEKNCIELKLSFNELFFCINAVNNNMIYEGVTPNTTKIMKNINLYFYNDKQLLFIEKNDKLHRIAYLISSGYYWIENKKVPIEKSVKYYNEKNLIAERVDFAITVNNKNLVLAVQNDIEKNKQNAIIFVTD